MEGGKQLGNLSNSCLCPNRDVGKTKRLLEGELPRSGLARLHRVCEVVNPHAKLVIKQIINNFAGFHLLFLCDGDSPFKRIEILFVNKVDEGVYDAIDGS